MTPEQKARRTIDKMLVETGWIVQNLKDINPGASMGVTVKEFPTDVWRVAFLKNKEIVNFNHIG